MGIYIICSGHTDLICWTFSNQTSLFDHSAAYDKLMTIIWFHWLIWYLILHTILIEYAWPMGLYKICSLHAGPIFWTFFNQALLSDHSAAYYQIMIIVGFHWLIWYLILPTILKEYAWAFIIFVLSMLVPFVEHFTTWQQSLLPMTKYWPLWDFTGPIKSLFLACWSQMLNIF